MSVRELLRARTDSDDPLARHETDGHPGAKDKKTAAAAEDTDGEQLAALQERLFAEAVRLPAGEVDLR